MAIGKEKTDMPANERAYLHSANKNIYRLVDEMTVASRLNFYATPSLNTTSKVLTLNINKIELDREIGNSEFIFASINLLDNNGEDLMIKSTQGTLTRIVLNFTNETERDRRYQISGSGTIGIRMYTGNEGIANVYYRPYLWSFPISFSSIIPTQLSSDSNSFSGRAIGDTSSLDMLSTAWYVITAHCAVVLLPLIN